MFAVLPEGGRLEPDRPQGGARVTTLRCRQSGIAITRRRVGQRLAVGSNPFGDRQVPRYAHTMAKGKLNSSRAKHRSKASKRPHANVEVIDPELLDLARVLAPGGETWVPTPGEASAGELAAELLQRLTNDPDLPGGIDDLLRCRERLSLTAQVAFDMARWGSSELCGIQSDNLLWVSSRRLELDQPMRDAWLLLASHYGTPDTVGPLVIERAKANPEDPLIDVACRLMARLYPEPLQSLLEQLATVLPDKRLLEIRRALPLPGVESDSKENDMVLNALEPFESALAPHFSLYALLKFEPPI